MAVKKVAGPVRLVDGVSIGLLATVFPDERVVAAIEKAGVREQPNRALPTRLMVYFALALWLDFGRGYVRVLTGLLSGLRWARGGWDGSAVPTDGAISLARGRLGDKPLKLLFDKSATAVGTPAMEGVFWRGRKPGRSRRPNAAPWRCWAPNSTRSRSANGGCSSGYCPARSRHAGGG